MAGKPTYEQLAKTIQLLENQLARYRNSSPATLDNGDAINLLLSASPIGIGLVDNRVIKRVNTALVRIFGYEDEKELVGLDLRNLYPSEEAYQNVERTLEACLAHSHTAQRDSTFKRKDGTLFQGHLKMSTSDPTTPMKQKAEQEQMEREKLLGVLEMAGAVCHEINQPLQIAMIEYAELRDMPKAAECQSQLDNLKHQLDTIGSILHKLMRVTRYKTRDYIKGKKIIDIDRASSSED